MKSFLVLIGLVFLGCGAMSQDEKPQSQHADSRSRLLGIWWSAEMPQSAAFEVNDSTFYYPDSFVERKYNLKADSIFIIFEDGYISGSLILKLTADTLVLSTNGVEQLYTRAEPGNR